MGVWWPFRVVREAGGEVVAGAGIVRESRGQDSGSAGSRGGDGRRIAASCLIAWTNGLQGVRGASLRKGKLVPILKIHPALGVRIEVSGET